MPEATKAIDSKRVTPKRAVVDLDAMTLAEQEKMYVQAGELGWSMDAMPIHRLTWLATWAVMSSSDPDVSFEEVGQIPSNKTIQADLVGKG